MLVNYRPEYRHGWGHKTYYTQLRLDPLSKQSADEMLSALLGDGEDLEPLKRLIIDKTEGNPFFMEEMVLVLFDEGALTRNGAVKLTRSLNQLRDFPRLPCRQFSLRHRPAGARPQRPAANACRHWPGVPTRSGQ